jgi:hypothetical protein
MCVCEWDNKIGAVCRRGRERQRREKTVLMTRRLKKKNAEERRKKKDNGNTFTVNRKARVRIVGVFM